MKSRIRNPKHPWQGYDVQHPQYWLKGDEYRLYIPLNEHRIQAGYIDLVREMYSINPSLQDEDAIKAEALLGEVLQWLRNQAGK